MSKTPPLRSWQVKALEDLLDEWSSDQDSKPLIAACPGAGKTIFAATAAKELLSDGRCEVVLVICPTVNIKSQWVETFAKFGIKANDQASNEAFRVKRDSGGHLTNGWKVICLTYSQIAQDADLFVEIARRHPTLVIADEVHHADEKAQFGTSLSNIAHQAKYRLALSGTPFNSNGGALSMCESKEEVNEQGRLVRRATPLAQYQYGEAIGDGVCRPVEFIKVLGKSIATYKSLTDDSIFQKMIDLSRGNKNDSLGLLLDTNGELIGSMISESLKALHEIKMTDKRAGMLVVARDKEHGARLCEMIEQACQGNPDWRGYSICEIYNDTPKAHDRIKALNNDSTDIVVTVRLISEGVDVKRLRVGMYASDYLTRMFFIQFIGRFCRMEDRLDGSQHARVVIPGHIELLTFAREIEKMIDSALVLDGGDGDGEGPPDKKNELILNEVQKTGDGVIFRSQEENDRKMAQAFFAMYPSLIGVIPESKAIQAARDANLDGSQHSEAPATPTNQSLRKRNEQLAQALVRLLRSEGRYEGKNIHSIVNSQANRAAGIEKVTGLTSDEQFIARAKFLRSWIEHIHNGLEISNVE